MKPTILLVDDDPDDLQLLKEAIRDVDANFNLEEAKDGQNALHFLQDGADDRLPCLIVLDINMPVLDGREMLAILKKDERLKKIPVVFFTTSSNPADMHYCRQFDVDLIIKPFNMNLFTEAARKILTYCRA
jgi:CheY-like chemotaxis protein